MGACTIQVTQFGKTVREAYKTAVEEAENYYGHHEGYSGAINSSHGYVLVVLPFKTTVQKYVGFLEGFEDKGKNTHIPKKIRDAYISIIRSHANVYNDKYASILAFEMTGKEAKDYRTAHPNLKGKKGGVFVFAGTVPE